MSRVSIKPTSKLERFDEGKKKKETFRSLIASDGETVLIAKRSYLQCNYRATSTKSKGKMENSETHRLRNNTEFDTPITVRVVGEETYFLRKRDPLAIPRGREFFLSLLIFPDTIRKQSSRRWSIVVKHQDGN